MSIITKVQGIPEVEWFRGRAEYLKAMNEDRDKLFDGIDEMLNVDEWELPEQLSRIKWVFKQVTTIFRQVVSAAVRILADVKPRIKITPYEPTAESRDMADSHEKALEWLLKAASRRRESTIVQDTVESSVKYAEVTQQCLFIPVQAKSAKKMGTSENRYKAMKRRGPFIVVTHNPRTVYARFSDMGLEEVCVIKAIDPHELVDLYGDMASDVRDWIQGQEAGDTLEVTMYDYTSYDWRAVWVEISDGTSDGVGFPTFEIIREKWKWSFIPWVCRIGGTSLEGRSDRKRKPILADAYYANEFDTLNRVKSMRWSEMLKHAADPKRFFMSDRRSSPGLDNSQGSASAHIKEDEKIGDLSPIPPDPGMGLLHQEIRMGVQRSTLSEILFGGEIPASAAFATINLVTHSALAVLKPTRGLAQDSLADLSELFLLWSHYGKEDLKGYGTNEVGQEGEQYLIEWGEIDPENLYIDVELTADLPTDRQQRMLTATNGVQAGLISKAQGREDIGITNANEEEERITEEQVKDTLLRTQLKNIAYENDKKFMDDMRQKIGKEIMAKIAMQQKARATAGAAVEAGGGELPETPTGAPVDTGQRNAQRTPDTGQEGGDLLDPNAGGLIPNEIAPGQTRESQTGRTQGGEEIAQV